MDTRRGRDRSVSSPTTVYIATSDPYAGLGVTAYLQDGMQGFDSDLYRHELAAGRLEGVALEDWHNQWTQGDNTFTSENAARAYADEHDLRHVLEVTLDDVRAALRRAFGEEGTNHV